jgi:H+/Cl- antiporter ClcA
MAGISIQSLLISFLRWTLFCAWVGLMAGSASAVFLHALEWATHARESNRWLIALLPVAGGAIGWAYHAWGKSVARGNNQLLDEILQPQRVIPLRMAPLVLIGTVVTHLFGGSAGREGTAVQMGGSLADQISRWVALNATQRQTLLVCGISAGFASVFGTPWAGALFALEVVVVGRIRYESVGPALASAFIGHWVCHAWQVSHTAYVIGDIPSLSATALLWTMLAGIAFGLAARLFSASNTFWHKAFEKLPLLPPWRPVIGGLVIALAVAALGHTRYIGLGIPVIEEAFSETIPWYDFLAKTLFTTFTLGAGFKGGEVTPLFFTGATLGNALSGLISLPVGLLAAMGFVAVFSGATNTPLACTVMGMELFGYECGVFVGLACLVAYFFSGKTGIYPRQLEEGPTHAVFGTKKKVRSLWQIFRKN